MLFVCHIYLLYYDVTTPFIMTSLHVTTLSTMTSLPIYFDVSNPFTMTSLPPLL